MLQAPCYPSPLVYGQSHYKKFWLRQTETEDETAVAPQHVANCSQKFSTLSSSFSPMAGSPSQTQNQAGSSKAGTSTPSSTNASLAACANSFNAPRTVSVALEGSRSTNKGVSEYDLNQFEDSSEPGAVDCTLSLGTVKRERSEAAVPTGVSRSGSPAFGEVAHAYYTPQSTWGAGCSEPQILFNSRNFPSDCTRDLYPQQTTVPARQSRLASGSQNHMYLGSTIEGSKTSGFPRPKKTPLYAVEKGVGGSAHGGENCSQDSFRGLVPGAIGLCRSTSWMPSLVIPEAGPSSENAKYSESPSPFSTALIASPISGHSSVNGEEGRFQQRSTILDLGVNGASSSKAVSRTCAHCSTQKTPLWRNGPNGPKSLCNACGIRFKKAGKKNPSNGSSSELGSSLPSSPHSGKLSSTKAVKRKKNIQSAVGISKQSWALEEGTRRSLHLENSTQPWKRNRSSSAAVRLELTERLVDTTTTESSGSEADENETGGSSGNSCLTWQHQRLNATVVEVPSASSHAFAAVDPSERSLDDFMKMTDVMSTPPESLYLNKRGETTRTIEVNAEDTGTINAEEAAICLMNMSHGFGLRL